MGRICILRPFGGRTRPFQLTLGAVEELERLCDAGAGLILRRLETLTWRHADIRETIRLGLVGGGLGEPEATRLIEAYVDGQPVAPFLSLAAAILAAYATGLDEVLKNEGGPAEGDAAPAVPPDPATSPPSSPSAS
ncbi:gene transfer agent family protein [Phreatobacter sp.]|uniref:gene transfer agent family protein n=1 Tax=Phreatobacter sp. TaxID=1966341 RepID=UPI003F72E91F